MKDKEINNWEGTFGSGETRFKEVIKRVTRTCPATTKAFLSRKYALPQYRQPDYYDQDLINAMSVMMLMYPALPSYTSDDVVMSHLLNLFQALKHDRPTLFLERELGEILVKTEIPGFLETQDIHFPFPSIRVHLPKQLLGLGAQDRWVMYLDIGYLPKDAEVQCPRAIAAELDRFGGTNVFRLSRMAITYPEHALSVAAQVDKGLASSYAVTKPLQGTLQEFKVFSGKLHTDFANDADDDQLLAGMQRLALNILLILSSMPLEYTPDVIERKERTEGKRIIPALVRARWVGDHLLRAKRAGHVQGEIPATGRKIPAHWVSGHWKHQPHGKGFALRRLVYILPYRTGKIPPIETK
jgi:hypothetical protein